MNESSKSNRKAPGAPPIQERLLQLMERMARKEMQESHEFEDPGLRLIARLQAIDSRGILDVASFSEIAKEFPRSGGKADWLLLLGVQMERERDYGAAVFCYRAALLLEPCDSRSLFYNLNNLGYSLCKVGAYSEAEEICRRAIDVDGNLPNGHKNLGIALAALDRLREAAQSFINATRACPQDDRSCELLFKLLREHPELHGEFEQAAIACRNAVIRAQPRQAG